MQFNFKLRTALLVAALAFGINLLIIEKNAMAQPAAPTPASNASESTASTASEGKPATNNTPPLTLPSLTSIYISIDDEYIADINKARRSLTGETDVKKLLFSPESIREIRDSSLEALAKKNLSKGVSASELTALTKAATSVLNVCEMGSEYIQYRLTRNSNQEYRYGLAAGLLAIAGALSPAISTIKGLNAAALLSLNRSKTIIAEGDTSHSNAELKRVLEQVRQELSTGINNYNKAMLMSTKGEDAQITQYRHLQAAVFEMNSACAFF